jgi:CubicO group peptidase (beta-lactamase class C family)
MRQILELLLVSLFLTSCGKGEISLEDKIDRQLSLLELSDKPGIEVFVKKDTAVLYHKSFGKSDLKTNQDLNINSVYNIASVSKEFTAVAILQIAETGKLSVGDTITKYIKGLPNQYNNIKIEHLLSHTSGIKRYMDMEWAENEANKHFNSTNEVIQYYKKDSLSFIPGQFHSYANMNYLMLSSIIETVSNKPYETYLDEYIFKPLGMNDTFFPEDGKTYTEKPMGYEVKESELVMARPHSYTQAKGPGGIHTTAMDLAKWYDGLANFKIISKESLNKAWSLYTLNEGAKSEYGFGFYNDEKFGQRSIFHNGFIFGYATSDLYFPKDDLLILVFSNISDINTINTNDIAFDLASILYQDAVVVLETSLLDTFVGTYQMEPGFEAVVTRNENVLFIEVDNQPANELAATSETTFRVKDFPAKVEFQITEAGEIRLLLSRGTNQFKGIKK